MWKKNIDMWKKNIDLRKSSFTFSMFTDILIFTNLKGRLRPMTDEEKTAQQYALVVKSNELIRKSRFSLSLTEQRIVLYLISKIKPNDTDLLEYEFNIKDFCEVCGIDYFTNLSQLKEIIKALRDKSTWITLPNGAETLVSWIEKPYLFRDSGSIKVRLDRDLMPYLLQLKDNFTQYELIAILALKSKFSLRLYELFKSYESIGKYEVSLEELRKLMMLENEYPLIADFRRYVIDKSVEEIERFTDLQISYEKIKQGRSITGFIFTIQKADDWNGQYIATELFLKKRIPTRHNQNIAFRKYLAENEIDPNQISLFDSSEDRGNEND